jgi:hypothetical protein
MFLGAAPPRNESGISAGISGPGICQINAGQLGSDAPWRHGREVPEVNRRRTIVESSTRSTD